MLLKEHSILVQTIDPESLLSSFLEMKQEIIALKAFFESKLDSNQFHDTSLLTRDEVAKFFKINISTVRNWSKNGILQPYFVGDRVYFKRNEILNALVPSNINTKQKIL
jgi:hypothetical protein